MSNDDDYTFDLMFPSVRYASASFAAAAAATSSLSSNITTGAIAAAAAAVVAAAANNNSISIPITTTTTTTVDIVTAATTTVAAITTTTPTDVFTTIINETTTAYLGGNSGSIGGGGGGGGGIDSGRNLLIAGSAANLLNPMSSSSINVAANNGGGGSISGGSVIIGGAALGATTILGGGSDYHQQQQGQHHHLHQHQHLHHHHQQHQHQLHHQEVQCGSSMLTNSNCYSSEWLVHLWWYSFFGAMIVIGLLGNLLIIAVITRYKALRSVTNCFLLNLTVSDVITLLFNVILNLLFMLNGHWPFGEAYCVANNFLANCTVTVSVFTITRTSMERYSAIVHPLRKKMNKQRALLHIVLIWAGAILLSLPPLLFSRTVHIRHPTSQSRTLCILKWPDGYAGKSKLEYLYNLLFLLANYLLPLLTMAIAYSLISRVLWGSGQIGEQNPAQTKLLKSKRNVVKMLIGVVITFGICWAPYHIYFLCTYLWPDLIYQKATQQIYLAIYWLAMSNAMLNPIILLIMNRRFRVTSVKLFSNCWPFKQLFSMTDSINSNLTFRKD